MAESSEILVVDEEEKVVKSYELSVEDLDAQEEFEKVKHLITDELKKRITAIVGENAFQSLEDILMREAQDGCEEIYIQDLRPAGLDDRVDLVYYTSFEFDNKLQEISIRFNLIKREIVAV